MSSDPIKSVGIRPQRLTPTNIGQTAPPSIVSETSSTNVDNKVADGGFKGVENGESFGEVKAGASKAEGMAAAWVPDPQSTGALGNGLKSTGLAENAVNAVYTVNNGQIVSSNGAAPGFSPTPIVHATKPPVA